MSNAATRCVSHKRGDAHGTGEANADRKIDTDGAHPLQPVHNGPSLEAKLGDDMNFKSALPCIVHLCEQRLVEYLFGNCWTAFGKTCESNLKDLVFLQESRLHYLHGRIEGSERLGAVATDEQP